MVQCTKLEPDDTENDATTVTYGVNSGRNIVSIKISPSSAKVLDSYLPIQALARSLKKDNNGLRNFIEKVKENKPARAFKKNLREVLTTEFTYKEAREMLRSHDHMISDDFDRRYYLEMILSDPARRILSCFAKDIKKERYKEVAEELGAIEKILIAFKNVKNKHIKSRWLFQFNFTKENKQFAFDDIINSLREYSNICAILGGKNKEQLKFYREYAYLDCDDEIKGDMPIFGKECEDCIYPDRNDFQYALNEDLSPLQAEWHAIKCVLTEMCRDLHITAERYASNADSVFTKAGFKRTWLKHYPVPESLSGKTNSIFQRSHEWNDSDTGSTKLRDFLKRWELTWLKKSRAWSEKGHKKTLPNNNKHEETGC